jgi:hypothetical protein
LAIKARSCFERECGHYMEHQFGQQLQDYPGISGQIQLAGKNFELIAKKATDKPGKPKEMYIRKPKDERATIDIVRGGNSIATAGPDHDFLLQDRDIIRINDENTAKFSR